MFAVRLTWILIVVEISMIWVDHTVLGRVINHPSFWRPNDWSETPGFARNRILLPKNSIDVTGNRIAFGGYNFVQRQPQPEDFVFPSENYIPLVDNFNGESAENSELENYFDAVGEEGENREREDPEFSSDGTVPVIIDRQIFGAGSFPECPKLGERMTQSGLCKPVAVTK